MLADSFESRKAFCKFYRESHSLGNGNGATNSHLGKFVAVPHGEETPILVNADVYTLSALYSDVMDKGRRPSEQLSP